MLYLFFFFFSSRRRHTRCYRDWSSDVCSSDLAEARVVSERLLRVLSRPYELPTGTAFVSASIGLAGCATAGDVPTLLRNADLALRFAKQRGKRRVEQYDAAYDEQVRRRTELEHELRGAAERGELMVVYQPVVRLPDAEHRHARVIGV